jgi:DNA-binding MarR family transcriptional regulator
MDPERTRGGGGPAPAPQFAQLLSQAERRVRRQLAGMLEREGCTVEEWRVLVMLAQGGFCSMSEIAEFALLPAPSLTRLVDRMVADNLLYRRADVRDRRRVLVRITRRGRARYRQLAESVAREQEAILVATDPHELAHLLTTLSDLVDQPHPPPDPSRRPPA